MLTNVGVGVMRSSRLIQNSGRDSAIALNVYEILIYLDIVTKWCFVMGIVIYSVSYNAKARKLSQ